MELNEMKILWEKMSVQLDSQKILTDKLIVQMTQERYANKFRNISIPETIGGLICLVSALILLLNFHKLDTWYLMACGIFSAGYLILMPIFVMRSLSKLTNLDVAGNSFRQLLSIFAKRKKQFYKLQRIGFYFNFGLIFTSLPLAGKILSDKDFFLRGDVWVWYLPMMIGLITIISMLGYRYYKKTAAEAEGLLRELEEKTT